MLNCLTSPEWEAEPQVSEGDGFVWLVGGKRARKSTNGYIFNTSTGTPAALQRANTPRFHQVYQI